MNLVGIWFSFWHVIWRWISLFLYFSFWVDILHDHKIIAVSKLHWPWVWLVAVADHWESCDMEIENILDMLIAWVSWLELVAVDALFCLIMLNYGVFDQVESIWLSSIQVRKRYYWWPVERYMYPREMCTVSSLSGRLEACGWLESVGVLCFHVEV